MPLTLFGGLLCLLFEQNINGTRLLSDVFFYARSGIYNGNNGNGYNSPAWYLSVLVIVTFFYFYVMKNLKKEIANLIIAVIAFFALRKGAVSNFFEKQAFAKIAKYCLSVYLTHIVCVRVLNLLFAKHGDWILSHSAVSIACVLLSVVALGVFAHHVIEKPASKALKEWLG